MLQDCHLIAIWLLPDCCLLATGVLAHAQHERVFDHVEISERGAAVDVKVEGALEVVAKRDLADEGVD